ncbi:MAG: mannonate dehydratase [Synoicihabitans sp.]
MKIAAVAQPPTETNLRTLAQIGVEHRCFYGMAGMPLDFDALREVQRRTENCGLKLSVVEGGPPIDRIVLGKDGRDAQIEDYKRAIGHMGKLGIRTLCYNFMPQITRDAMVIRTSFETPERGGALTSSFRLEGSDNDRMTEEGVTSDEQMWDYLDYFLRQIVPVAEEAEVNLAMHPDDPPLSPMWNLARIMRSVENYDRLFAMHPSPVNGMTFCQGCFGELGVDLPMTIEHFSDRIHFAHFRDVRGNLHDFRETFPDNGPHDMVRLMRTYKNIGYEGFIRVDHVPQLAIESESAAGYGLPGHIFAIGYLKGLMEPFWPTASADEA